MNRRLADFQISAYDRQQAGTNAAVWKDGRPWRNAIAGGYKGGRGKASNSPAVATGRQMAQASAKLGQQMRQGNADLTRQFLAGGRSRYATGGNKYNGFTPRTAFQSQAGQQMKQGNRDLMRQFVARGTSKALTGTKAYNGFTPRASTKSTTGRQMKQGNADLTQQFKDRGTSKKLTGTEGYKGYRTAGQRKAAHAFEKQGRKLSSTLDRQAKALEKWAKKNPNDKAGLQRHKERLLKAYDQQRETLAGKAPPWMRRTRSDFLKSSGRHGASLAKRIDQWQRKVADLHQPLNARDLARPARARPQIKTVNRPSIWTPSAIARARMHRARRAADLLRSGFLN